jgi:alpha-tubulin suppressor-like RCC1 family protein
VLVERRSGATWVRVAKAALSRKSTYSAKVVLTRGSYVLRVRKDFSPAVAEGVSKAFTVVVNPPAPVVTTTPPAAVVGRPYSTTLAATSDGPVTWSVSAGALPAGLALSSTGLLSGRPVVVGPTAVTVAATDSLGQTGTLAVTLTVAPVGLRAMGRNSNGQLGTGSTTDSSVPALAQSPGGSWLTIAACENYTLGLRTDGTVWSWGSNAQAQLGDGTTADHASPTQIQALTDIVAIAAGDSSAYAVSRTGAVFAWGDNSAGQLGNGSVVASRQPIPVPGLTGVTSVAAGDGWAVAVRGDGTATSWGYNLRGNLGNGAPGGYRATPGPVVGLTGAVAVAGAGNDTYALLADGTVRAWGANNTGQLGDGFTGDSAVPRAVYGLTGVTALAASVLGGYALRADGTVSGWGGSDNYRLGNNEYDNPRYIPVTIPVTGVVAIAAGYASGYALTAAGTIVDWGQDATGELGDGHPSEQGSPTPAPLAGLTGVVAIAAGNGESAFALVAGG